MIYFLDFNFDPSSGNMIFSNLLLNFIHKYLCLSKFSCVKNEFKPLLQKYFLFLLLLFEYRYEFIFLYNKYDFCNKINLDLLYKYFQMKTLVLHYHFHQMLIYKY